LGKVLTLWGRLADEQQCAHSPLLGEQSKAGPGWHGVVEDQQVRTTFSAEAGVKVSDAFADAHVEHTLAVEGLVQEDLVGRASLVD
jgi:hypothetical protein